MKLTPLVVERSTLMPYNTRCMLRFLRVRNFALIDHLEIHFEDGFNLLSGETGAGKSIVVDALSIIAGSKALSDTIRTGESRAIVEAVFEADVAARLEQLGLDAEGSDVIIRREISSDGRNRVFINNQPSTVSALKELVPLLLDIHGQHDQQTLMDSSSQLDLVDAFAGVTELAGKVRYLDGVIQKAEAELAELIADHARKLERLDLLRFQSDEIQKANPKPGETETAHQQLAVLTHATKLLDAAMRGYTQLYESDGSVSSVLSQTARTLRDASQYDQRLEPLAAQAESARIQIQDVAAGLRDYAARVEADPQQVERLQSRLAELERLHRKYGPDLLGHLAKVTGEMDSMGLAETQKGKLLQQIASLREAYNKDAMTLSRKRRAASTKLETQVIRELKSLAMPNVRFEVQWSDVAPGRSRGVDAADFLISANPGEDLRPLEKVASGGELSRIMLALRTVMGADDHAKTLVFDEVDAGVGGKAAETVGQKLKELSTRYQILCVTHLAQVASCADHHYRIEKLVLDGRTVTRVEPLVGESRVDELVRMMSGSRVTDAARQHIREMLASRQ
ncbi:MAG TPA: DNA repair protein RecN [Terriglobia bacterium]|nr:DNA repair protein RecN [Terriglobia bacterium]